MRIYRGNFIRALCLQFLREYELSHRLKHAQQNNFGKALIEVWIQLLYASSGTFCVQIGQLFTAVSLEKFQRIPKSTTFSFVNSELWTFKHISKTHCTVSRIIDQYGRKRCKKKQKDVDYNLQRSFLKIFYCI